MLLYTKNMVILLTSICLFFSSFYLLLPTLPLYVMYIGGTQPDVGIIIGAFTLSSVLFRPLAGKFTDIHGRKPLLIAGALIFFVSPFLYFLAATVELLLLVRLFHGIGIAAFAVSSVTMIADMAPPDRRGEAFGAFGLSAMIALTGSPAVGTWLLTNVSFAAVFSTEAVLAGSCVLLSFFVREPVHTYSLEKKGTAKGWLLPSVTIFLCTITYGSIVAFLPFFAQNVPDFGLYYTFYALSSITVRIPIGKVSDRIGRQKIVIPGLVTTSVSLMVLSQSHSLSFLALSGILYGLGFSSVYPTLTALLVDRTPENARARGLSYFTASFDLGIAAGSVIFGLIPLLWIYPLGAVIVLSGILLFFLAEYL